MNEALRSQRLQHRNIATSQRLQHRRDRNIAESIYNRRSDDIRRNTALSVHNMFVYSTTSYIEQLLSFRPQEKLQPRLRRFCLLAGFMSAKRHAAYWPPFLQVCFSNLCDGFALSFKILCLELLSKVYKHSVIHRTDEIT